MTRYLARCLACFALLLLLVMVLAGCTGNGGDDSASSANADRNPPVAAVEETPGATANNGSDGTASGPNAAEVKPADVGGVSGNDPESTKNAEGQVPDTARDVTSATDAATVVTEVDDPEEPLPFMIDLGATSCIPCKMMAPILEDLSETKSDYFDVIFYDVWEDRSKGQQFGIRAIPTQIFFSAQGEELYRHEGYFSRKQILDKWRELGVDAGE